MEGEMNPNDMIIDTNCNITTDFRTGPNDLTVSDIIASGAYKLITGIETAYRAVAGQLSR
jgi:hypothetical protein